MKALILAAGEAKRLKPITENKPKCLLPVGDQSIIDYQIDHLRTVAVTDITVVTGFYAEKLETHLTSHHPDVQFTFIRNDDYYKTYPAYGMYVAKDCFTDDVLYLNADVVFHADIIKQVVESEHDSVTAMQRLQWDEEQVNIILNSEGQVTQLGKHIARELNDGEFIGVTKIGKEFGKVLLDVLYDFVAKEETKKFAADALNLCIQRGSQLYALDVTAYPAIEIDTPDDLIEAQAQIKNF